MGFRIVTAGTIPKTVCGIECVIFLHRLLYKWTEYGKSPSITTCKIKVNNWKLKDLVIIMELS